MYIVGLTGGIACGKSTVATFLRQADHVVIDADQIARDVVQPGQPALQAIAKEFGDRVIDENGVLKRRELGRIVFADPEARKRLEDITHPEIFQRTRDELESLRTTLPKDALVFYENALLVETGLHTICDLVVAVSATLDTQQQRLRDRDPDLSEKERTHRMDSQLSTAEKAKYADLHIQNNGSLDALHEQVMALISSIQERQHG